MDSSQSNDNSKSSGWAIFLYCVAGGLCLYICYFLYKRFFGTNDFDRLNANNKSEFLIKQDMRGKPDNSDNPEKPYNSDSQEGVQQRNQNEQQQTQRQSISNQNQYLQTELSKNQQSNQNDKLKNVQDYLNIVQKLYDLSINKREVEEEFRTFVGPPLTQKKLIQYYADDNEKIEDQLKKQLKGFRRVRGDGNCFYTAFTYQYLELVLNVFDQRQFDEIIAHIRTMLFQMEYEEEFSVPQDAQNALAKCFADRLSELRKNPKEYFQQFSDPNNLLYGLSILFMRNLVNEIYLRNEMAQSIDGTLSKDFLYWEKECNMNEIVIAFLAEELKLQINCYFVDSQKDQYKHEAYYEQGAHSIHLILQPGHYQIGVPKIGNK